MRRKKKRPHYIPTPRALGLAAMKKNCNSTNAKVFLQGKQAFPAKKPLVENFIHESG